MLTQSPRGPFHPHIKKAIVISPASLIQLWAKEVKKWLGQARLRPTVVIENSKKQTDFLIQNFATRVDEKLLIISYEQIRVNFSALEHVSFDLMVCDEGHRLKNPSAKITQCISSLKCSHRIILTGTPFQNNLSEYRALVEFVNPGFLGTIEEFRKSYERPILAARGPDSDQESIRFGLHQLDELIKRTSTFILKRTSKVLEAFLPPKIEQIVFCLPTCAQVEFYRSVLSHLSYDEQNVLQNITKLMKICNHPELVLPKESAMSDCLLDEIDASFLQLLSSASDSRISTHTPYQRFSFSPELSGKMIVLAQLAQAIRAATTDKLVVLSSFTKTLDVLQKMFESCGWKCLRLDGNTELSERSQLVDRFQCDTSIFIFLLSTKAGGVGLNLCSANRLVLFDSAWNPAFDSQALARVWRDGQTKTTWIYRLLSTGMIDEKIFQRQLMKNDIGELILEQDGRHCFPSSQKKKCPNSDKRPNFNQSRLPTSFASRLSIEDLKDIFSLNCDTRCDTHDISGCRCELSQLKKSSHKLSKTAFRKSTNKVREENIGDWVHYANPLDCQDEIIKSIAASKPITKRADDILEAEGIISFIFSKSTTNHTSYTPSSDARSQTQHV
ncbi:DNA repair and recombination protein RAD54B-like [Schistocerca gregaria]|uniref:DNA repair and recombination protein RAD54B-like n=1 Tax=Schistocerca gregaria TaxID=7010 RepID=UPI00211DB0E8|nr:DNA repair and recombination protein RAD54B-like [Schistocerca gregaria]